MSLDLLTIIARHHCNPLVAVEIGASTSRISLRVSDNQRNTLPLADTDKIASILNTLNCDYTLQMLHSMQRPTVNYNLAITKRVRIT